MTTTWQPTQDRVLLRVDPEVTSTASGLTIPKDTERPSFDTGTIISVGQITPFIGDSNFGETPHSEIKPGRRAVFHKESGYPILLEEDADNLYVVLNVNDIYFISYDPEASVRAY